MSYSTLYLIIFEIESNFPTLIGFMTFLSKSKINSIKEMNWVEELFILVIHSKMFYWKNTSIIW